jgi:hypothetical protein
MLLSGLVGMVTAQRSAQSPIDCSPSPAPCSKPEPSSIQTSPRKGLQPPHDPTLQTVGSPPVPLDIKAFGTSTIPARIKAAWDQALAMGDWHGYRNAQERPHQGRWCFGKTPMQTFLDAIPIARKKMIAA